MGPITTLAESDEVSRKAAAGPAVSGKARALNRGTGSAPKSYSIQTSATTISPIRRAGSKAVADPMSRTAAGCEASARIWQARAASTFPCPHTAKRKSGSDTDPKTRIPPSRVSRRSGDAGRKASNSAWKGKIKRINRPPRTRPLSRPPRPRAGRSRPRPHAHARPPLRKSPGTDRKRR